MTDLCSQYRKIPDSKYHLFIKRFYKGFLNLSLWEVRYMSNRLFRARRTVFSVLILFAFMISFVAAIPGVSYASPPIVRYDYAPGKYSDNGPYSYSTYQLPGWRHGATVYYPTDADAPFSGIVFCPPYMGLGPVFCLPWYCISYHGYQQHSDNCGSESPGAKNSSRLIKSRKHPRQQSALSATGHGQSRCYGLVHGRWCHLD